MACILKYMPYVLKHMACVFFDFPYYIKKRAIGAFSVCYGE